MMAKQKNELVSVRETWMIEHFFFTHKSNIYSLLPRCSTARGPGAEFSLGHTKVKVG